LQKHIIFHQNGILQLSIESSLGVGQTKYFKGDGALPALANALIVDLIPPCNPSRGSLCQYMDWFNGLDKTTSSPPRLWL